MRIFPKHAWLMVLGLVLMMAASRRGGTTTSGSTQSTPTSALTTAPTPTPHHGQQLHRADRASHGERENLHDLDQRTRPDTLLLHPGYRLKNGVHR